MPSPPSSGPSGPGERQSSALMREDSGICLNGPPAGRMSSYGSEDIRRSVILSGGMRLACESRSAVEEPRACSEQHWPEQEFSKQVPILFLGGSRSNALHQR